ncbi:MAG TPA: aromatic hydrocarbon degradation protein [Campylobacterales bacterium]|nr:aromatic hydrocarbon degradation protein [Campylobacterales bacterium]
MKKIILLSTVTASMLLATNGDLMMGHGVKATGMGGVGIAVSHGAESAYANPAMIKDVKGSEFSGSVTMFMPDVQFASDAGSDAQGASSVPAYQKSDADQSFLPEFAYAHRNNEHIVWGIAVGGTAGMGVDQVGKPSGAFNMKTELQVAKLGVPVAYTNNDLTLAVEPVLQYSTLQMNYQTPQGASNNPKSTSTGFGVNFGVAYDVGDLTLGALYQSKIEAEYKDNISVAMNAFGVSTVTSGDSLDQPAEMGIGAAYKMGASTFAMDLKRVEWSKVKGYKDFGWDDQNIIALGYQYATPTWALRAGYNHGKSPIKELNGAPVADGSTYPNAAINFFNLAGFPAVVEEHFTLGGDYSVNDNLALSLAVVYSPEVSNSFNTTAMSAGSAFQGARAAGADMATAQAAAQAASTGSTANVKHSQQAVTLGATYRF